MSWDSSLADIIGKQTPARPRDIEQITGEILSLKVTFSQSAWDIGTRLIEAKAMLSHGEWLPWLEQGVDISVRTAHNFMAIVRNYPNSQALANLGATKVLSLLAVPAEEREEFIEATHIVNGHEKTVGEMSSRELQRVIKERDEAVAKVDAQQERIEQLEDAQADVTALQSEVTRLTCELFAERAAPVDVAVMAVDQQAIDDAKAEAAAQMQDRLDRAIAAQTHAEEKLAMMQSQVVKPALTNSVWKPIDEDHCPPRGSTVIIRSNGVHYAAVTVASAFLSICRNCDGWCEIPEFDLEV